MWVTAKASASNGWAIILPLYPCAKNTVFSIIQAAGWPIWPLIACSVLALALVLERFVALQTTRVAPPRLLEEVLQVTARGLPNPEVTAKLAQNSALGEVLASGLQLLQQQPRCNEADLRATLEGQGRAVAQRLEKSLTALATIASAAPLLGLLGTVIGMIEIFGASPAASGGNPVQLAHGISVALYNTAFGLIVAIPTLIFWRYFRSRVDAHVLAMELATDRFARHLLRLRAPGAA